MSRAVLSAFELMPCVPCVARSLCSVGSMSITWITCSVHMSIDCMIVCELLRVFCIMSLLPAQHCDHRSSRPQASQSKVFQPIFFAHNCHTAGQHFFFFCLVYNFDLHLSYVLCSKWKFFGITLQIAFSLRLPKSFFLLITFVHLHDSL